MSGLGLGKGDLIGTSRRQRGKGLTETGHLGGHGRLDHDDTGTDMTVGVEYSGLASMNYAIYVLL